MRDAEQVTDDIAGLLEAVRGPPPAAGTGVPPWPAFDWRTRCDIKSVAVYATAGMRLAERQNPSDARVLWDMLNSKLAAKTGLQVTTRTLSGFEEGLYAWLAVRETQADDHFGSVEMGGASVQVTFPCSGCRGSKPVRVRGHSVPIFSQSFLGLGQDEAWKKFGARAACRRGAGLHNPDWQAAWCTAGIDLNDEVSGETLSAVSRSNTHRWYLGEALQYLRPEDVDRYCRGDTEVGFEPERACFRTLYQRHVLRKLGVPGDALRSDADWTLGAVICTVTNCLEP